MTANTAFDTTTAHREREITAHFAGHASPAGEAAMRAHLSGCLRCKQKYERRLLFARLDPSAMPAVERIGKGLGFAVTQSFANPGEQDHVKKDNPGAKRRLALRFAAPFGAAVAAMTVAVLSLSRANDRASVSRSSDEATAGFTARGSAAATGPAFWVYLIAGNGSVARAEGAIGAHDELAFAYSNPTGKRYLMIFGVDEHRHVYWFHPGWPEGAPAPSAISAVPGPGPHELQDAVRHELDGRHLTVHALLSDGRLDAMAVENVARAAAPPDFETRFGDGTLMSSRSFEVTP